MDRNEERQSFVMYASFLEAAEQLEADAFKECVLKLRDYALFGAEVNSKHPVVNAILTMAKPNINAAAARYQRCIENGSKGKEYGSMGGRPRKGETKEDYDARKGKTPRKPLDVEEKEKEKGNKKHNDDAELIQPPAAVEPTKGSVTSIGFSFPISVESVFRPDNSGAPSREDIGFILNQHSNMSKDELANRYENVVDKLVFERVHKCRHKHEALLATEAALICKRYNNLPTLDEAKRAVVQDLNAAVQMVQEESARSVEVKEDADENDKPF